LVASWLVLARKQGKNPMKKSYLRMFVLCLMLSNASVAQESSSQKKFPFDIETQLNIGVGAPYIFNGMASGTIRVRNFPWSPLLIAGTRALHYGYQYNLGFGVRYTTSPTTYFDVSYATVEASSGIRWADTGPTVHFWASTLISVRHSRIFAEGKRLGWFGEVYGELGRSVSIPNIESRIDGPNHFGVSLGFIWVPF